MEFDHLRSHIRDVPDFPKPGIVFKDITPLLLDPHAFRETIEILYERYADMNVNKIAAIESRGFIFAAPLAYRMGAGLLPLRKPGKLPFKTVAETYSLEYGEATLEVHDDAVGRGDTVLLIDDLLATGGTAAAAIKLIERLGGNVIEAAFIVNLAFLGGADLLAGTPVFSMIDYD